jgi:hypothetical protein
MNVRAARITTAVDELADELAHAEALIDEQQARIAGLERDVRLLQSLLEASEAA